MRHRFFVGTLGNGLNYSQIKDCTFLTHSTGVEFVLRTQTHPHNLVFWKEKKKQQHVAKQSAPQQVAMWPILMFLGQSQILVPYWLIGYNPSDEVVNSISSIQMVSCLT